MAVEKVWKCDLCGVFVEKDELRRLGVRTVADRMEDADVVDVGPECHSRPLSEVLVIAAEHRAELGGPDDH